MKLGCIVMAAGSSSRFGANKLLAEFRGQPLFCRALDAIPPARFAQVVVVTGYEPVRQEARRRGCTVVCNDQPALGVSRTIRLGLEPLVTCDGVLFMTADQPLLSTETVEKLADFFEACPQAVAAAAHGGKKGNPCLFPRALFPELLALEGDHGGSRVIRAHPDRLQLVEVPARELLDCDTVQALQSLQTREL